MFSGRCGNVETTETATGAEGGVGADGADARGQPFGCLAFNRSIMPHLVATFFEQRCARNTPIHSLLNSNVFRSVLMACLFASRHEQQKPTRTECSHSAHATAQF